MSNLPAAFRLPSRMRTPEGQAVEEKGKEWNKGNNGIPSIELLSEMTLSDFRESGLVVVVRCSVLGEEVVWAADRTPLSRLGFDDQGRVIYHGEELRLLHALASHPEDLVAYHAMRKAVGRVVVDRLTYEVPAGLQETPVSETPERGEI